MLKRRLFLWSVAVDSWEFRMSRNVGNVRIRGNITSRNVSDAHGSPRVVAVGGPLVKRPEQWPSRGGVGMK